jgi:hypothetical protein
MRLPNPAKTLAELPKGAVLRLEQRSWPRAGGAGGMREHLSVVIRAGRRDLANVTATRTERGYDILEAEAEHGWGPLAYDLLMERATELGQGLGTGDPSHEARAVWEHYAQRPDVSHRRAPSPLVAMLRESLEEYGDEDEVEWFPEGDLVFQKEPTLLRALGGRSDVVYLGDWEPHVRVGPTPSWPFHELVDVAQQTFGVEAMAVLGCGQMGCAYLLADGRVLKITSDWQEVALARLLRNPSPGIEKGIARVESDVVQVADVETKFGKGRYAYVREYVEPVESLSASVERELEDADAAWDSAEMIAALKTIRARPLIPLRNALRDLAKRGLVVTDLKTDNLGRRSPRGPVVLFDGRLSRQHVLDDKGRVV